MPASKRFKREVVREIERLRSEGSGRATEDGQLRQQRIQRAAPNYLKAVDNAERPLKNLGPELRSISKDTDLSPVLKQRAMAASKAHSKAVAAVDDLYNALLMLQNAVKRI